MPGPSSRTHISIFPSAAGPPPIVTRPAGRPYLIAFSTRLNSTCCKRSASACACTPSGTRLSNAICFSSARERRSSATRCVSSRISRECRFMMICPLSRREIVRRSSIRNVSRSACFSMVCRKRVVFSGSLFAPSSKVSTNPLIKDSGVRSSWLTLATNSWRVRSSCLIRVRSWNTRIAPR